MKETYVKRFKLEVEGHGSVGYYKTHQEAQAVAEELQNDYADSTGGCELECEITDVLVGETSGKELYGVHPKMPYDYFVFDKTR